MYNNHHNMNKILKRIKIMKKNKKLIEDKKNN